MTGIVDRLRKSADILKRKPSEAYGLEQDCREAADHIERLTADLERVKGELAALGEKYESEDKRVDAEMTAMEARISTLTEALETARAALLGMERYHQFVDGWGDEVLGVKQHPTGDYVKWTDILTILRALPPTKQGEGE